MPTACVIFSPQPLSDSLTLCLFFKKENTAGTYTVSQCPGDAAIAVTSTKSMLTLTVHMTSPVMRTEQGSNAAENAAENEGAYAVAASERCLVCVFSACKHCTAPLICTN